MIQELPIHEDKWANYYDEPLLDYVCKVANNFWMEYDPENQQPVGSSIPQTFASRYFDGKVDNTGKDLFCKAATPKNHKPKHRKFDENINDGQKEQKGNDSEEEESIPDISTTLEAYRIDISKFWYLCVFLKDYITGETIQGVRIIQDSPRKSLEKFVNLVNQLHPHLWGSIYKTKGNAELTLRVGKGKKNKVVISDGHTLALIRDGINLVLNYPSDYLDFYELNVINREKSDKGKMVRIALFYKYMLWFLDSCTINKEVVRKSLILSTSKILLISRLIYILGLSDNVKFLGEGNETYLRTYISGYEDVKMNVDNKFYGSGF